MARPTPHQILVATRDKAFRLAERTGGEKVRVALEKARRGLQARLKRLPQGRFTHEAAKATLAQVRVAEKAVALQMGGILEAQAATMSEVGMRSTLRYLHAAETQYRGVTTPLALDRAMLFDAELEGVQASLLRQQETSVARYGLRSISKFEEVMQQGILQQLPMEEMVEMMTEEEAFLAGRLGWAERIVRTETMYSYGRAAMRGIQVTRDRDWPDMRKVLVGYYDSRTGSDTPLTEGQVRRPEEPFIYRHPRGYTRAPFMETPKRPNCRCVVVAWRPGWPPPPTRTPLWGDLPGRFGGA